MRVEGTDDATMTAIEVIRRVVIELIADTFTHYSIHILELDRGEFVTNYLYEQL
jgi:hypothetical protein